MESHDQQKMLASLTRKHMHALQQTNKRKRDNEDTDELVDKKLPTSSGMILVDHMIIVVMLCDITGNVEQSDEVR